MYYLVATEATKAVAEQRQMSRLHVSLHVLQQEPVDRQSAQLRPCQWLGDDRRRGGESELLLQRRRLMKTSDGGL